MSPVAPRYVISRIRTSERPSEKASPVIVQSNKDIPVKTKADNLAKQAYNAGKSDFNNRIKYLLKAGGRYNKYLNTIMGYSNSQMREAENLYPEKGQYKNVPQSGWQTPSLTSLLQLDALSTSDRIGFGLPDRKAIANGQKDLLSGGLYWGYVAERLAQEKANEGGNFGPRQKYLSQFAKNGIKRFEDFIELKDLKKRDDPISQLVAVQAEDLMKRFHYLTDDTELKKLTNVDLEEEGLKKMYVTVRLFPDPVNTKMEDGRAEPSTWYMRPDQRIIDVPYGKRETMAIRVKKQTPEGIKEEYIALEGKRPTKKKIIGEGEEIFQINESSDLWDYAKPYLLASPLGGFTELGTGKSIRPVGDLVKPYYTVSPLTQTFLQGYKKQMSELPGTDDPKLKKEFFEKDWLFGTGGKPMGQGAAGIPNITNMYGDSSNILAYHNPMGLDLILKYATAKDPQQVDYNDFLKKRFASQRNFQVNLNPDKLKNPFLDVKEPIFNAKEPPMFAQDLFNPKQDFGIIDQFKRLPGVGGYALSKFW